jgi:hypothetical protein
VSAGPFTVQRSSWQRETTNEQHKSSPPDL